MVVWHTADEDRHLAGDVGLGRRNRSLVLAHALAVALGDRNAIHPALADPDEGKPVPATAVPGIRPHSGRGRCPAPDQAAACTTSEGKLGGIFLPITDEQLRDKRLPEELPQERIYGGKIPKLVGRPGTIYEFERSPEKESTIYGDTRRWVGFLNHDPRAIEWQAKHDAFFAAEELKRQEKHGKNKNLIQRQLAPLKVAYSKMVGHQRAAFLAQVIGYITGRVSKADLRWAEGADTDEDE